MEGRVGRVGREGRNDVIIMSKLNHFKEGTITHKDRIPTEIGLTVDWKKRHVSFEARGQGHCVFYHRP